MLVIEVLIFDDLVQTVKKIKTADKTEKHQSIFAISLSVKYLFIDSVGPL